MLTGKTVVLGITGSIAAYKMANVAAARYSAASYMMKLMKEEVETA